MISNILLLTLFQIFASIFIIIISKKIRLLDYPNERKIHAQPMPYTGGVTLGVTFIFIVWITDFAITDINIILSFGILIAIAGFIDDKYNVNPGTKIILQTLPIFFILDQGIYLNDLGSYNFFGTISLGSFAKVFTLFASLLMINAFNYCDGLDGLLASLTISIFLTFLIYLKFAGSENYEILIYLILALVIFLIFNFGILNFKTFLGDSGSNLLGFTCAFISIHLYINEKIHPSLIIWSLAFIVYEFLSVNIFRLLNNKQIFRPGRDHLHYQVLNKYHFKNYQILLIVTSINFTLSILGLYIFVIFGQILSILLFGIFFLIYCLIKWKIFKN